MAHFKKVIIDDVIIKEALGNIKYDVNLNERITRPGVAIVRSLIILVDNFIFGIGFGIHRDGGEGTSYRDS